LTGTFILSLDCEGKWGIADHLGAADHEALTDARLALAYHKIIALLDDLAVPATFAFTDFFLRPMEELAALEADEIATQLPYTRAAFSDMHEGSGEGWSAPWLIDALGPQHEVASHGVTHSPWSTLSQDQARFELSLYKGPTGRTFVYPRNDVAHLDLLAERGFIGFRLPPRPRSRSLSLASEFNLRATAEPEAAVGTPQPIPGGFFVNWLSGGRRLVPKLVTRMRARNILRSAVKSGGVAHFWTHPENIASAPATFDNLRAVLEEAVALQRTGDLKVATQLEYCASRSARAAPGFAS
jgi:peptidoglycan/xylan/chitin deacetylase (PgdA/CDA1 family)